MRSLLVGLGLVCVGTLAAGPKVEVFRGTLPEQGEAKLEWLGDLDNLDGVRYASVEGRALVEAWRPQLKRQAEFYLAAQRAVSRGEPRPLPVILDPAGDWSFARSRATFTYDRGRDTQRYQGPVVLLGERRQFRPQTSQVDAAARARNRAFRDELVAAHARALLAGRKPAADFLEDGLRRTRLVRNDTEEFDMVEAAELLSTAQYLEWLEKVFRQDLAGRGGDADAGWRDFLAAARVEAVLAEVSQASIRDQVVASLSHEMGHVVHFVAVGSDRVDLGGPRPHMEGGSHTFRTLSSPEFAFVEGFAAANAMVTVGQPPAASPGEANRIDYSDTVEVVRRRRNQGLAQLAAQRVAAAGQLAADQPLTVPPFDRDAADFRAGLRSTLTDLGWTDQDWADLEGAEAEHPELSHLAKVATYVEALQAKKGQLRGRADFLRSEYAVGSTLAALRIRMGQEASWTILDTLAAHAPTTLAGLIEAWVEDNPRARMQLYESLAEITEGILVSPAELEALGQTRALLQLDIDRDGKVPGEPLPGSLGTGVPADPLAYRGTGATLFPQLGRPDEPAAPPRLRRVGLVSTEPSPAEPSLDGLLLR